MLALQAVSAHAHTVSYGYVAGTVPGTYTFWFGTYHTTTNFTEGQVRLTCGGGFSSTQTFTILATTKPAGLTGGVNYFYDAGYGGEVGSPLYASTPTHTAGSLTGPVARWQGATFTNITYPGTCTFTYVPIAAPTQDWDPNGANGTLVGIRGASFNLTIGMTIAKTSTTTGYATVGQLIPYKYVVTNTGGMVLTAPLTVTDNKTPVTCPAFGPLAGTAPVVNGLAVNASLTCSGSYTVTQADIDAGSLTNTVSAKSGTSTTPYTTPTFSLTIPAAQAPGMTVLKTSTTANFSTVGTVIPYSYKVTNSGNTTLTSPITIADNKIASVSCPALPAAGLAPGAFITCNGNYTTTQADIDAGGVTNTASSKSGTTGSPTVNITVPSVQNRSMSLAKATTTPTYATVGQSVPFTYVVRNTGNTSLTTAITVTDDKISAVTCPALPVGGLAPGAAITCSGNYIVTQAALDTGSVTNIARANSGPTASPNASVTINAVKSPAMSVVKATTATSYSSVGQVVPYTYKVTNTGNTTLTAAITVADNKIPAVTCPALPGGGLAPGAFITCTGNYTVTQTDLDAGSLTNVASSTSGTTTSPTVSKTVPAAQTPGMTVAKTSTSASFNAVGQIIPYSYKVTNSGNTTLTSAITVTDNKIAAVTCPALPGGVLAPGAFITCTANYTVTQADLDAGSVTNLASSTSGSTTSPTTSATVPAVKAPALTLLKTSTTASYSAVGQVIPYSYKVTNTGNVTLTAPITINDNKIPAVACPAMPAGGLAPGAFITCTASATVTQADLDAGSLTNIANGESGGTFSPNVNLTIPAAQTPAMTVLKTSTATNFSAVGQIIPYSYKVTNSGNTTLTQAISVTDNKIASVSCPALPAGGLVPAASLTCTASYAITQADIDAGAVTNTASSKSGTTTSPTMSATVNATQTRSLVVAKSTTSISYASVGQVIPYSYVVTNTGNTSLTAGVTIADNKIASVSCPALPASGLAPNASLLCTGDYTVTQADLDAGALTNTASATSGVTTSPTVSKTVPATQAPSLAVVKTSTATTYTTVGQVIPYSYAVTNTGNTTLTSAVSVTDNKIASIACPALPAGGLSPGAGLTCTGNYTVTQADIDAGNILNTASAKSGSVTSFTTSLAISGAQTPGLTMAKTSTTTSYSSVGQIIAYSYKVTNSGNTSLTTPVTVADNKIASVSCPALPAGGLTPGAFLTCSGNYNVTQADIDNGNVANTATATSGAVKSNTMVVTIPAAQSPRLTMTKNAPPAPYTAVGQVIVYTFVTTNAGNTTITVPISISDDRIASVTCPALPAAGLAPGGTLTCSGSYTVTQADLDAGSIVNTATTKSGPTVSTPPTTHTQPAGQTRSLAMVKTPTATTYTAVGQSVSYSYKVTNTSNVTLTSSIAVSDNKIAGVACPALPPGGLAPGSFITCAASYTITQADIDAGAVTNAATATSGATTSPTVNATVTATKSPSLSIAKLAGKPTYAAVGDSVPYSYKVTNTGNTTFSTAVTIADNKIASVSCPALPSGGLAPGAFITCAGNYSATQADLDAGSVTNTASATSGATTSPTVSETVNAVQSPAMSVVKSTTATAFATVGQILPYSFKVTNTGNVALTQAISVTDSKIASVSCPALPVGGLPPAAFITCTANYAVTQADLDAGAVTNFASSKSGIATSPTVSVTVNATQSPAMTVLKSSTSTSLSAAGQIIPYSYLVTNTGNVTLTSAISVSDNKIATVTCPAMPASGLAPSATLTCTANYTVTQADIDAGSLTNIAVAKSGTTNAPPSSVTINAALTPAMTVLKSSTAANFSAVGQVVPYSYKVTNTGNVTLTSAISVNDNKIASVSCPVLPAGGLPPGGFITCSGNYTVTQADLNAGSVTNSASAKSGSTTSPTVNVTVNAAQTPAMTVVKSTTTSSFSAVGQIIPYSYKVTNSGNVTLTTAISVSDDKIPVVACPALPTGGLLPGAFITCSGSYTITQADIDAGAVANTASSTSGPTTSPGVTISVPAAKAPALSVVKGSTTTSFSSVGQIIPYTFAVANTGNTTFTTAISVSDSKIAAVTCPALPGAGLAPGASLTCSGNYSVTQTDIDAGSVTNTASASSGSTTSPIVSKTIAAVQAPALTTLKSTASAPYTAVGQSIAYSYRVTNTGNTTVTTAITVNDNKIPSVACPAIPGGLAPGLFITCTGNYSVTQADIDGGSIVNTATANSGAVASPLVSVTLAGTQSPKLTITKTSTTASYNAIQQSITYDYRVTNTGTVTLTTPVAVTDSKIGGFICGTIPGAGLAPGAFVTCSAPYSVTQADLDAGSLTNTASATSGATGLTVSSNTASLTIPGVRSPALTTVKSTDSTTYATVGQSIIYNFAVTNTGNTTITSAISVTDTKIASVTCASVPSGGIAPGDVINCTGTYAITQADIDAGSVLNAASAKAGATISPTVNHTLNGAKTPALTIVKSAQATSFASVGQILPYTYTVTNTGNTTLTTAITVSDNKIPTVTCPALPTGGLAPAGVLVCKANYAVTQADIDAGSVANRASAASGTTTSPPVNVTVNATQSSALTVVKTSTSTGFNAVGQIIPYSFKVTNTGNTTLTSAITVTDSKITTVTCLPLPGGILAPNTFHTCTANYTVTQADIDAGSVTNAASARSGTTTSPTVNLTVNATQSPAMTVVKSSTTASYATVGQVIPYSYLVTNTGNTTLTAPVTIADNKIAAVTCPALPVGGLAPLGTLTCNANYTVTQSDIDTGSLTNTASARSGTTTSPTVAKTINAAQGPALTVLKTSTSTSFNAVGQQIPYSYKVTNTGNTTLTVPITVSDNKIAAVSCPAMPAGGLAPGAFITCAAAYAISQADIDAGSVANAASAKSGTTTSPTVNLSVNAAKAPALTVRKSTTTTSFNAVGQRILYTYVVTNSGNTTLTTPVTVSDNKIASVTCPALPVGGLAPAGVLTCSATYVVTQADLDLGSLTNLASANSGTTTSPTVGVTISAAQAPSLMVAKSSTTTAFNIAGQIVPYSYRVTNTGNTTLTTPVTITDNKIATVACPALPAAGLAPNAFITCSANYSVTQADVDLGSVTNTATSKSGTTSSPPVDATVSATRSPALAIVKSSPSTAYATLGQTIPYSYLVTNSGNTTLTAAISISDNKIPLVSCPALPAGGLAPGAAITCSANYTVVQSDLDSGILTNLATAQSGATTSPTATKTISATQARTMSIVKTSPSTTYASAGQSIRYSYRVTNTGNTSLTTTITVVDDKIANVVCPAFVNGTLAPGAFLTCTATYVVKQADIDAGSLTNIASGKSGVTTSPPVNLTLGATLTPALTVVKSSTTTSFNAVGQIIPYIYVVTNSGNTTLTAALTVTDNKIASVVCPALPATGLAPAASLTCTANYSVTQADIDAGTLSNSAFAKSGTTTSPTVMITINAAQAPAMTVVKTSTTTSFNVVGQVVPYSYKVTNTGNTTLTQPITVADNKIAAVICPALPVGGLAPTAFITCTATYAITQADLDLGSVANTASAASGPTKSPNVTITITAAQAPAITVVKATTSTSFVAVGDILPFTYRVTNSGNTTITTPVTVTDNKIAAVACPALPAGGLAPAAVLICTASYKVIQADLDAGSVTNTAVAKSGAITSPQVAVTVKATQKPEFTVIKSTPSPQAKNNGDGTYTANFVVVMTNTGNVTLSDVQMVDDFAATLPAGARLTAAKLLSGVSSNRGGLPTLNAGYTATSANPNLLVPAGETLAVGEKFTIAIDVTFNPGATPTALTISNTVVARSRGNDAGAPIVISKSSAAVIAFTPNEPLIVAKTTPKSDVTRGELVPYTITVRTSGTVVRTGVTLVDLIPPGFKYKDRSATINGLPQEPKVSGRQLSWAAQTVSPGKPLTVRLILVVGSGAGNGEFHNDAWMIDGAGAIVSNVGRATVRITADPTFDCTDIIGKVFDDADQSGYPDEGKRGIANVRLATVKGQLITTDSEGRFHIACADTPDNMRGANFILKLDERTLPTGYRVTTENPRVIRITAGKMAKINFGAALQRVARMQLANAAFIDGGMDLRAQWGDQVAKLIPLLRRQQSILRIAYRRSESEDHDFANKRIRAISTQIKDLWRQAGAPYELKIETEVYLDQQRRK